MQKSRPCRKKNRST